VPLTSLAISDIPVVQGQITQLSVHVSKVKSLAVIWVDRYDGTDNVNEYQLVDDNYHTFKFTGPIF